MGGEDGALDVHCKWIWLLDEWDYKMSNRHNHSDGVFPGRFKKNIQNDSFRDAIRPAEGGWVDDLASPR